MRTTVALASLAGLAVGAWLPVTHTHGTCYMRVPGHMMCVGEDAPFGDWPEHRACQLDAERIEAETEETTRRDRTARVLWALERRWGAR